MVARVKIMFQLWADAGRYMLMQKEVEEMKKKVAQMEPELKRLKKLERTVPTSPIPPGVEF